jgi:hypothetical protein
MLNLFVVVFRAKDLTEVEELRSLAKLGDAFISEASRRVYF